MTSIKSIIVTNRGINGDITQRKDFTPEKLKSFGKLEYVFVPFWRWYIPRTIYRHWKVVIFHMTDLPYGRGGSPLQNLIVRGFTETKISAVRCVKEIDAGPIYCMVNLSLDGTADQIYNRADGIIRDKMIPFILAQQPEPCKQKGKVVIFDKWVCTKDDVMRCIDSDFEW